MTNYINAMQITSISDKPECYLEDMDCRICKYRRGKNGCKRTVCACEDERADAIAKGRIKRRKGWSRRWDKE